MPVRSILECIHSIQSIGLYDERTRRFRREYFGYLDTRWEFTSSITFDIELRTRRVHLGRPCAFFARPLHIHTHEVLTCWSLFGYLEEELRAFSD
jgi:hypothetical protein